MPPRKTTKRTTTKSKGQRKGKRKSTRPVNPTKRRLIGGALVTLLAVVLTFFWIDHRVGIRLVHRGAAEIPAIYTDTLRISADSPITLPLLKEELLARGYSRVTYTPKSPGDFHETPNQISGITRAFQIPNGSLYPATPFQFPFPEQSSYSQFYIEPRIVAPLISGEQRASRFLTLKDIPVTLQHAVVAIEDERFYEHHGLDLLGIMRAMLVNLKAGAIVQGGSTLTQQLAKNILFTPERTIWRKIGEAFAALSIEHRLPKERIIEMYLNEVYLGQSGSVSIHGVSAGAQHYFGKSLHELTTAEMALIAGLIKAPSAYSPRRHLTRAVDRRNLVLQKMFERGYISAPELKKALQSVPVITNEAPFERKAPFFVNALRSELERSVGVDSAVMGGLKVYTGLQPEIQECAEKALSDGITKIERGSATLSRMRRKLEGGIVAIEPASGLIRAWVGGKSYADNQFDHVNQAKRQVGSTLKPFIYLTALDGKLNSYKVARTTSILSDEPIRIDGGQRAWEPENYDKKFRGDVTVRYALEHSLNLPAVYLTQKIGAQTAARTVERFHISPHVDAVPSLALGALDTSLLSLTSAFGALANGGRYVTPRLYISLIDSTGEVINRSSFNEEQVASDDAVFVLTNMLQGVIERGTARGVRSLGFTRAAAGKTGTSDQARDAWFVGFTPNLVAGVWVGLDNNKKLGLSGGAAAVPIWTNFMNCAQRYFPEESFIRPPGVVLTAIDIGTGRLATEECPLDAVIQEVFVRGTEPQSACHLHPGRTIHEGNATQTEDRRPRRRRDEPNFFESLWDSIL